MARTPRAQVVVSGDKVRASSRVVVFDNKRIHKILAKLPDVHGAIVAETGAVASKASAMFAQHDNPGGHHIEATVGKVDGLVSLVGPAPAALELGHVMDLPQNEGPQGFVKGIHVLTRAAGI